MGEVQTLDKSNHSLSGLNLSLFLCLGCPVECVHLLLGIAERRAGTFVVDSCFAVFVDEDLREKCLVAKPPVCIVRTLMDTRNAGTSLVYLNAAGIILNASGSVL